MSPLFYEEGTILSEGKIRKKDRVPLTTKERREANERFPDMECSIARDDKGYYAYTHRCRSKSYPSIAEIPKKTVEFVGSTS